MLGGRARLKVKRIDETMEKVTNKVAHAIFKKAYEQINHEAEMLWRNDPQRFLDGKVALWNKFNEEFRSVFDTEIMYLRREQKKKINTFCVRCGHYRCFEHCNFGDCGADIIFKKDGQFLMSDYDDEKHYPANTDGTPHLLCFLQAEMSPQDYHIRCIEEERKLQLRWRRDPFR